MRQTKKKIAAVAAVITYIKTQEETAPLPTTQTAAPDMRAKEDAGSSTSPANIWGLSGRQQQMQMRCMMQMKAFYGSKKI